MTSPEDVLRSLKINPDVVLPENVWAPDELTRESIIEAKLLSRTKSGYYNVDSVNKFIRKASSSVAFYHDILEKKNRDIITVAEEAAALLVQNSNLTLDHQLMQNETIDKASYDIALKKIADLEEALNASQALSRSESGNISIDDNEVDYSEDPNVSFDAEELKPEPDSIPEEDFDLDIGEEVEEVEDTPFEEAFDLDVDEEVEEDEDEETPEAEVNDSDISFSLEDEDLEDTSSTSDSYADPFEGLDLDIDDEDEFAILNEFSTPEITEEEALARGISLNGRAARVVDPSKPLDMTLKTNVTKDDL